MIVSVVDVEHGVRVVPWFFSPFTVFSDGHKYFQRVLRILDAVSMER